jgi:hypothetical protein
MFAKNKNFCILLQVQALHLLCVNQREFDPDSLFPPHSAGKHGLGSKTSVMKQSLRRTPRKQQQQHIQSCRRRRHEILFFQKDAGRKVVDFRGTKKDTTRQEMSGIGNEESESNGGGNF